MTKQADDDPNRTIGQVARAAGVNLQTVRYYQRRGLIAQPPNRHRAIAGMASIQ